MKKDVKNYSYKNMPQEDLELISKTCEEYAHAYNYFTERYSGIRNLVNTSSVTSTRINIRNVLYKDTYFRREVPMQVNLWKCALEDATANIRSMWSNLFNKIRRKMYRNENLNNTQRHLINYLFTLKSELEKILNKKNPDMPEYFSEDISEEMFRKTCILLRRYIRRYKPKKSKNYKKRSYNLTSDMYKYVEKEGILYISVMTSKRGKRVEIPLKSNIRFSKNIRLVLDRDKNRVVIHSCIESQTNPVKPIKNKEIGIDKGIKKIVSTSTKNTYGTNISNILKKKADWETEKLKRRKVHLKAYRQAIKNGNVKKANKILENNLGKKAWNRIENRYQENIKSKVNHNIRLFFTTEKPETIVLEDLSFTSWTKPMNSKKKYLLSSWFKGYLDDRFVYLAEYYNCKIIYVNPAYTSQVCSFCGHLDKDSRKGERFKCTKCGSEIDADINGAINILERSKNKRINLYTPYKKVKQILEGLSK